MKRVIFLLALLLSSFFYAQENDEYVSTISKEDSLVIASYRIKLAQNINPYPDSAFYYSRRIKALTVQRMYGIGIADADYLIGQCHKRVQQNDSAIYYFKEALTLSRAIDHRIGMARAYNSLCRTYYLMGEMEASIDACEKAIESTYSFDDPNNLVFADSHIALSTAYSRQNKLQEAIRMLLVVDSVHKAEPLRPDVIAASYQNLGSIYLDIENYDASEDYYIKANDEFKKIPGDVSYYLNTTHINLGRVYFYKNDLEKADSLLTLSYNFFSSIQDERNIAEISTYLGQVKVKNNQLLEGEAYFKEGLSIHKKYQRNYEASLNALELAKLSIKKEEPDIAIAYLQEAESLNTDSQNSLVTQETNSLLAKSYALKGDFKEAFSYSEKATHIKDSLQKIQSAEKIKEIEAIYQTKSRDREIELLTSQNELVREQKKNQKNILLGILILTGLIGLFFFFQYRNRQKINQKLKEVDKAKSTFFANISHEFRTPLTLIKGPLEDQLATDSLSRSQRKNLLYAQRNTKRLEYLVEQLLALSKLESGNFKLQVQPGNLSRFIASQAEAFSFSSQEKQIDYTIHLKDKDTKEWFDRDAMEKILFNLIGNAVKFTPEHGTIELVGERDGTDYQFIVINSGAYLNPVERQNIFTRFYQTGAQNVGTGIGLALTKELVELHKGSINVESEKEGNTSFTVRIPITEEDFDASEILSASLQEDESPATSFSEENTESTIITTEEDAPVLLIIDDNAAIRDYITSIFETEYKIHTAEDGKEGLEKALESIPDIIISDVMMPYEDGFSLTKKLKDNELTSHIPVALLTAKTEDKDKLQGIHTGADAYITKPFGSQFLKATINNLLENRRKIQQRFSQEVVLLPKDIAISSADEKFLERLQKVIDEHLVEPNFSADSFSIEMGVSRMQLHRKLKAITGQTASEFLRSQRLKFAASLLKKNKAPISEIGYMAGFNDPSYFAKCFKQEFGCTPTEYNS